ADSGDHVPTTLGSGVFFVIAFSPEGAVSVNHSSGVTGMYCHSTDRDVLSLAPLREGNAMPIHDWTRVYAGIFHDFHHEWITTIKQALNQGVLPPDYYALAEQVSGGLHPDVLTLGRDRPASSSASNGPSEMSSTGGGIALATVPPRVRFTASAEE